MKKRCLIAGLAILSFFAGAFFNDAEAYSVANILPDEHYYSTRETTEFNFTVGFEDFDGKYTIRIDGRLNGMAESRLEATDHQGVNSYWTIQSEGLGGYEVIIYRKDNTVYEKISAWDDDDCEDKFGDNSSNSVSDDSPNYEEFTCEIEDVDIDKIIREGGYWLEVVRKSSGEVVIRQRPNLTSVKYWHSPFISIFDAELVGEARCLPGTEEFNDRYAFGSKDCVEESKADGGDQVISDASPLQYSVALLGGEFQSQLMKTPSQGDYANAERDVLIKYHFEAVGPYDGPKEEEDFDSHFTVLLKYLEGEDFNGSGLVDSNCTLSGDVISCDFYLTEYWGKVERNFIQIYNDLTKWSSPPLRLVNCEEDLCKNPEDNSDCDPDPVHVFAPIYGVNNELVLDGLEIHYLADICEGPQVDSDHDNTIDQLDNCKDVDNDGNINDGDGDGVGDICDNCVGLSNPDQEDADSDGIGDVCDICANDSDPDQVDYDNDGKGDACDICPLKSNPNQEDVDSDGVGDVCDICPNAPDSDQLDFDHDGVGDVCDNCPEDLNPGQGDSDSDGIGDRCDICPINADPNQDDSDGDGVGNACDVCPDIEDSDQLDFDHDGLGDVCDNDDDADGILDEVDNCPRKMNADQADVDGDGIGDKCDSSSYVPPESPVSEGNSNGSENEEETTSLQPPSITQYEPNSGTPSTPSKFIEGGCTLIPQVGAVDPMAIALVGLAIGLLIIRRRR